MSRHSQILHFPAAERVESDWASMLVGDLTAGEFFPLSIANAEGENIVEKVSMWRHDRGVLPYERVASSELFYLIEGRVRIEAENVPQVEAQAGDVVVVPVGFTGTWHTLEPVVKISVSTMSSIEG